MNILIIDDDRDFARSLEIQLELQEFTVRTASTAKEGFKRIEELLPDVILQDLKLRETDGLKILTRLREQGIEVPVIMITGEQDTKANIEAVKQGVVEYIRKPFPLEKLVSVIKGISALKKNTYSPEILAVPSTPSTNSREIIGSSHQIQDILKQIGLLARSQVNVLIRGESGTGKEIIGRALHEATSPSGPFIAVNCTAIVGNLLESELFGHEKGAFTGADRTKAGMFELAGEGTLFLDEIGDLPLDLQPKILRVIQEREFTPVGGVSPKPFLARIIAVTHRDLDAMIGNGSFREDLFYRISVANLHLPPLRERKEDVELLVLHLLGRISCELHRPVNGITKAAVSALSAYDWPGNVREMANVLTRAVALASGDILTESDLQLSSPSGTKNALGDFNEIIPLDELEKQYLEIALELADWNITHASEKLGITRTTLRNKINLYGLKR